MQRLLPILEVVAVFASALPKNLVGALANLIIGWCYRDLLGGSSGVGFRSFDFTLNNFWNF